MPLTPDADLTLLFPASLLPPPPRPLPPSLHLRPLSTTDHTRSHLLTLSTLTSAPSLTPTSYALILSHMSACPSTYYPIVVLSTTTDQILATATLILEQKFVRGGGKVGHVEDVAVRKEAQGQGLGKVLLLVLMGLAERLGAYKVILDCNQENIPFYEKCGMTHKEYEMVKYFGDAASAPKSAPPPVPPPTATTTAAAPAAASEPGKL